MSKLPGVSMSMGMIIALATQATGQVLSGTKVGTLNCQLAPSVGFIVGGHQPMRCRYTPEGAEKLFRQPGPRQSPCSMIYVAIHPAT
jgi:hypothetical protein